MKLLPLAVIGFLLTGSSFVLADCSHECVPMETEALARHSLKTLLRKWKHNFPKKFEIIDLDRQITNVKVSGPRMTFDPPGQRYLEFDFDTGCGAIVHPVAIVDECGRIVNLSPWDNFCVNGSRSEGE